MRGVWGVRLKSPWRLLALHRQMGTAVQLKDMGLFKSQGLIGATWTDAEDGRTLPVNNPATGELLTSVPFMSGGDTQKAITAASHAFPSWSMRTASDRSKLMRSWFNLLIENKDDLAKLMVLEQGKPLAEAAGEIVYGASFVEYYAEEGKRIYGDIIPSPFAEKRMLVMKHPVGVVGAVTPWNFPLAMITRKVAPALAAGCTVVVKPSELTPLTALAVAISNLLLAVGEARKVDMYHTETSSLQGFYSTDWEEMQELLSSGPWSPAHSHVEQARNTLAFATRAKEVTNTTHINMVVSDKVLVKQLQKEVARLEPELKVPDLASEAASSEALLQALPSWSEE